MKKFGSKRGARNRRDSESGKVMFTLVALLFFALFCAVIYVARHPLMRFTAETWVVEDPMNHADAIIVLGDDNFYADRSTRAAQLFREGKAPIVVASGRRLRPNAGIAELMEHDLFERGVPKEKIIRFPHDADSTREEAQLLTTFVAEHGWHSIIAVTSNYHTRRARYILRRVFPQDIDVRIAAARDGDFDPENWWKNRKSIKELTRELFGMTVAMWELREKSETTNASQSLMGRRERKTLLGVCPFT
jgi:uncharacterized SAM-binding protein YcdF (DUF218 family)